MSDIYKTDNIQNCSSSFVKWKGDAWKYTVRDGELLWALNPQKSYAYWNLIPKGLQRAVGCSAYKK